MVYIYRIVAATTEQENICCGNWKISSGYEIFKWWYKKKGTANHNQKSPKNKRKLWERFFLNTNSSFCGIKFYPRTNVWKLFFDDLLFEITSQQIM